MESKTVLCETATFFVCQGPEEARVVNGFNTNWPWPVSLEKDKEEAVRVALAAWAMEKEFG